MKTSVRNPRQSRLSRALVLVFGVATFLWVAVQCQAQQPPAISTQPQSQTNWVGATVTFTVLASGTEPLAYQWERDTGFLDFSDLAGCTATSLYLTNVQPADAVNYRVVVTNAHGAVTSAVARLSVIPLPTVQFSASLCHVAEYAGGVTLTVLRSGDSSGPVSVDFATANITATAGADYVVTNGTLFFPANVNRQNLTVPILNDGLVENTETFRVTLSNPTNATLRSPSMANVQVYDNDTGLRFESASYKVADIAGFVLIGVARGDDGDFPISVDCFTSDGTATNGLNYLGFTNTLIFAAGDKLRTFTIPVFNDGLKQPSRTFSVGLRNPTNQVLSTPNRTTVTVLHDDGRVQFQPFNQYWIAENEGALSLTVARGNDAVLAPFTVDFATSDLTASSGVDYQGTSGMLRFAQGELAKTITVPIRYDEVLEGDKKFKVTLDNPTAGTLLGANATATVTILDTTGMMPHRIGGIALQTDRSIRLTLAGGVHSRFRDYYDLYPIEVSSNLVEWSPLVTLPRTNSLTTALTHADSAATNLAMRFYRTPGTNVITPYRPPSGPFPVGVASRMLTDPTRRNRYGVSTNGSFMVSVWYPAVAEARATPYRFEEPPFARDPSCFRAYWGSAAAAASDRRPYLRSYSLCEASPAATEAPWPIVIYSPGHTGVRATATELAEDFASHGYVVVSVDHSDADGTVYPDGTYLRSFATPNNPSSVWVAGFQDRVKDLFLILEGLTRWNSSDPAFVGRLDLSRVATMGHSWGGGVAGEVGRVDERVRAVILLDAYLQEADELVRYGLSKPFLGIYSTEGGGDSTLYSHAATQRAIWFMINPSRHDQFHAYHWLAFPSDLSGGREVGRTVRAYALWFLNKCLKGLDEPMPAQADYPRVSSFKQK